MPHVESRRASTGGLPPIRIIEHYVVEKLPTDNNIPCFTAWIRIEAPGPFREPWTAADYAVPDTPPDVCIQFYDTTPGSDKPDHLKALAEMLHKEAREDSCSVDRERIDVWGMPLASDMSEKERVEKCKAHAAAEVASRNCDGVPHEYPINSLSINYSWQQVFIIIDRPMELWDHDAGGFLVVYWDAHPSYLKMLADEGKSAPGTQTSRYTRERLEEMISGIREDF